MAFVSRGARWHAVDGHGFQGGDGAPARHAVDLKKLCQRFWRQVHRNAGVKGRPLQSRQHRGAAVPGVVLVWLTTLYAAKQFYDVSPVAGGLLGLTAVWITVAGALVADTWRINNAVAPEPLYPHKPPGTISVTRLLFEDAMTS